MCLCMRVCVCVCVCVCVLCSFTPFLLAFFASLIKELYLFKITSKVSFHLLYYKLYCGIKIYLCHLFRLVVVLVLDRGSNIQQKLRLRKPLKRCMETDMISYFAQKISMASRKIHMKDN